MDIKKKIRTPYTRRAKRDALVGKQARQKQDQRKLSAKGSKQRTAATMQRMSEYKKMAHGGKVCRGGGAATRGLGFRGE